MCAANRGHRERRRGRGHTHGQHHLPAGDALAHEVRVGALPGVRVVGGLAQQPAHGDVRPARHLAHRLLAQRRLVAAGAACGNQVKQRQRRISVSPQSKQPRVSERGGGRHPRDSCPSFGRGTADAAPPPPARNLRGRPRHHEANGDVVCIIRTSMTSLPVRREPLTHPRSGSPAWSSYTTKSMYCGGEGWW